MALAPTSTPSSSLGAGSGMPISSIIGGTVSGVAALVLISSFLFLYLKWRATTRCQTSPAVEDQIEAGYSLWDSRKDSDTPRVAQELPSPELTSTLPSNNGESYGPSVGSPHQSFARASSPAQADCPDQQHLHPLSELEGPNYLGGSRGEKYHELDSGPLPQASRSTTSFV